MDALGLQIVQYLTLTASANMEKPPKREDTYIRMALISATLFVSIDHKIVDNISTAKNHFLKKI